VIASKLTTGKLIALDKDPDAISVLKQRLPDASVVQTDFRNMKSVLDEMNIQAVDGVLLDLGVSSHQLDVATRGFSYNLDAPLDMRMAQTGVSAHTIVNTYSKEDLTDILFKYGEESYARSIANAIVKAREVALINTTLELAEIVKSAVPSARRRQKNPCKQTFQAIRIAVNGELDSLTEGLKAAFASLKTGGRLVVITFHSIEDRLVKHQYQEWEKACTCPKDFPVCICGNKAKIKMINRKPIVASVEEQEENRRYKSAKVRIMEKL
ncbi:MAG: 16S rRNA (cytosine(1402)-N(4))-methyltransferase RsmH, partial [Oscillospiraceae bacterium]